MASRLADRAASQLSGGGVAVWSEVIALAKIPGVTDLGQGWPDIPSSKLARQAAIDVLQNETPVGKKLNQYSPIAGQPSLRQAISKFITKRYGGSGPDPDKEICVTTSGTEALYVGIQALCNPGDEVVLFEPFFPWYLPCVKLAGAIPKVVTLAAPDFEIKKDQLDAVFSNKTKLVVLNSPHNPTGHVVTQAELDMIGALCVKNDAFAIYDEVYETCVFDNKKHLRLGDVDGMADRTVSVGSAGKIFNLTGWRLGWMTGPADLIAGCNVIHGYTTFSAATPLQEGIAAALNEEPDEFYSSIAVQFATNFKTLGDAIRNMGHTVCCANGDVGGYFLVADISSSGKTAMEWCHWLAKEKGVACVPLSVFYTPQPEGAPPCTLVRFAICKQKETIDLAASKMLA